MSTEKDKYSPPLWFWHVADIIVITLPVLSEPNYVVGENSSHLCPPTIKTNYKFNLFKKYVSFVGQRRQRGLSRIWKYDGIITKCFVFARISQMHEKLFTFCPVCNANVAVHCQRTVMSTASHPPAHLVITLLSLEKHHFALGHLDFEVLLRTCSFYNIH